MCSKRRNLRCTDPSINETVDFLILDSSFTLKAAEATCKLEADRQLKLLNQKAISLKEKKTRVSETDIDMNAVVQNAVDHYRDACYAYSSMPENRKPIDRDFNQLEQSDLHEFRLCALEAACSKAVADCPPIAKESQRLLVNQGTSLVIQYGPMVIEQALSLLA